MTLTLSRRAALLATTAGAAALLLPAGLALATPAAQGPAAAASATPHHPKKTRKPPRPKPGLYVSGEAAVTTGTGPSAYIVDRDDREHFATLVPNATHPGEDTVVYYTRALGAKHWTVHNAPTLVNGAGSPRLEEALNPSTTDIEVVVYACDGVYAADAHSSAGRLPEFTVVQTEDSCSSPAPASAFNLLSAVTYNPNVFDYELGVVVPDQEVSGTWDLVQGQPGSTFATVTVLPTADSFVPAQFAATQANRRYASVVGYGVDGSGNEGIYVTSLTWTYNSSTSVYDPSWSDPKEIATLDQTDVDFVIESVTNYSGTIDVGLYQAPGSVPDQRHTLFVDEGDASNQWSSPIVLQHTTLDDKNLVLVRNQLTGTLHATFQRSIGAPNSAKTAKSGILKQYQLKSNWSKPTFLTHWFKDRPLQASVDSNDKLHVSYLRS